MEKITVRTTSLAELTSAPNFQQLIDLYAEESALPEIGRPFADLAMYAAIEQAGVMSVVCAYQGGLLVGFIVLLANRLPHYGQIVATTESFYVHPDYRKGGTGKLLLGLADHNARGKGAVALMVCAPADSTLDKVLPLWGLRHTNTVYTKALSDG